MSQQTALLAIAAALRDEVAPHLPAGYARLVLLACRHMLLRMAHPSVATDELPPLPLDQLPDALRSALSEDNARPLAAHETPAENTALSADNGAAIDRACAWVESASLTDDRAAIAALADWEGQAQDGAERLHEALDIPRARDPDDAALLDPQAVEAYFRQRYGKQAKLTSFTQLLGGRSKQTALLTVEGTTDLPSELVIRRDQTAQTMSGSVVQEFPLLQAVFEGGVAVPEPLFLETSLEPLGKAFVVMERLPGKSLGTHFDIPQSAELAFAIAEQLARLHAIPVDKFASVFPNAPQLDSIARCGEQFEQMREGWYRFCRTPSITMSAAFRWLEQNLDCADGSLSLIHGDLGFHNMLLDGERFVALLDWETAHIEHPAGDLGYVRPVIERMVPWQQFFKRYLDAGGRPITPRQVHFFGIWEILRINIQLRHCRELYETGATDDPMLGEVGLYYVPRFIHRISQHLRRALHDLP